MIKKLSFGVLLVGLSSLASTAFAQEPKEDGFFSKIGDAISGHVNDVKARFAEGAVVQGKVIKTSNLRDDLPGTDAVHYGTGTVTLEEKDGAYYVQFAEDTKISFAPDLNIYISKVGDIVDEEGYKNLQLIHLGEMTKPNGASFYKLPDDVKPADVHSVLVWCRRFSEFMSSANFKESASAK
jgi:hypothetical protein